MTTVTSGSTNMTVSTTRTGRSRAPLGWAAAFALAWLLPLATHLIRADFLLPVLVVAGLASLQRGTAGWFDRLVVSLAQLFPALCVAGLLFSVWPWHLHPVAVGGFALTVLVLLSLLTGRRPARPGRWRARDWVLAVGFGGGAALTLEPFVLRDLGGRLGVLIPGEDLSRHFLLFDMIGQVGGYAFLNPQESLRYAPADLAEGIRNYPQGTHFSFAVLDHFIRSSDTAAVDGTVSMDVMVWLCVAAFVFLVLSVLWGARRVAGAGASPVRLLATVGLIAAWLYFGDPVSVLTRGYPNELVGLALAALLTALVARPLSSYGEQLATVALLLVGISFSYHLFLPYSVVMAGVWAWRERLWRRPVAWLVAVLIAAPMLLTPLLNAKAASGYQLTLPGTAQTTDRVATLVLIALALFCLVRRGGLRAPGRRNAALAVVVAGALSAAVATYQLIAIGRTIYYFEKTLHLVIIVGLVGLGGLARALPRRTVPAFAVVLPLVVAMIAAGGRWHDRPASNGLRLAAALERGSPDGARDAILMTRMFPDGGGMMNVDLMSSPYRNWYASTYASVMQRNYKYAQVWYLWQDPLSKPKTLETLEALVRDSPVPIRFFVFDPQASFLVLDPDHPVRASAQPGVSRSAFGDPQAKSNIDAAEYLATKYPDKVQIVHAVPPNR
ncbi:hypothetical protein KZZ52_41110 [Dactylosporangium sp. AC04546]|uniref:hypothetical protein n=1 Tax=Dactylosporangium sp. AC04546 TaxID=2862460 RepID=UPI001EDD03B8|nr:hypothetical protein [Dactylosporangium sp. AC04546]WVK80332.1 hypothetical protein KZZ52_41110 [Dactylosporangium sp. AC04546]